MRVERRWAIRLAGLGPALALALCAASSHASHPPPMPEVERVLVQPSNPDRMVLATRYGGYYVTADGGRSFAHVCEAAMGYDDTEAYPGQFTPGGQVIVSTGFSGIASSQDGCGWTVWAPPGSVFIADVSLVSERTLVALNGATEKGGFLNQIWWSTDSGSSWQPRGAALAPELMVFSVLAKDDAQRLYVSARGLAGSELARSLDGGATWVRTPIAPDLRAEPRLLAITSGERETIVVALAHAQTDPSSPADVLVASDDAGQTWRTLFRAQHGLPAAAVTDDTLWFGGPEDGLWRIELASATALPERISRTPTRGLTWAAGRLFSIGLESADGYAVAVSNDQGRSFAPLFRFCDRHESLSCGKGSSVGLSCSGGIESEPWQPLGDACTQAGAGGTSNGNGSPGVDSGDQAEVRGTLCSAARPGWGGAGTAALFVSALLAASLQRRRARLTCRSRGVRRSAVRSRRLFGTSLVPPCD